MERRNTFRKIFKNVWAFVSLNSSSLDKKKNCHLDREKSVPDYFFPRTSSGIVNYQHGINLEQIRWRSDSTREERIGELLFQSKWLDSFRSKKKGWERREQWGEGGKGIFQRKKNGTEKRGWREFLVVVTERLADLETALEGRFMIRRCFDERGRPASLYKCERGGENYLSAEREKTHDGPLVLCVCACA